MRTFKIVEKKNLWYLLSTLFILTGLVLMVARGVNHQPVLNFGIDFAGGTTMMLKFENDLSSNPQSHIADIRTSLAQHGLEKSTIQLTQNDEVIIKTLEQKREDHRVILDQLTEDVGPHEVLEIDYIGPSIGNELKEQSIWIIISVSILLLLYITIRFQFNYGIAALAALAHDTLVIISFASIFNAEINTTFIAAVLTVLGYSINDTIVIFDRIRENVKDLADTHPLATITNISLSQTLIRTINTSMTTLVVISSLILFGGTTIKGFCIILLVGILSGTYSSLFIASPILVASQSKD